MLTHGSLFSGIGGFDLAADWMGWQNLFHCEYNPFGNKVLKHYWPDAESFTDIKTTDFKKYANKIDILTGGFPCQPYSFAGSRKGTDDSRHLWPEMLRAIREIKPRWIVGENVPGIINWSGGLVFEEIQINLESEGYEVLPVSLPAIAVGADHVRERVWFIAYANRMDSKCTHNHNRAVDREMANPKRSRQESPWRDKETNELDRSCNNFLRFEKRYGQPPVFSMDDGLPFELDGITVPKWVTESHRAAGNAIVPQVAFQLFKTIQTFENLKLF